VSSLLLAIKNLLSIPDALGFIKYHNLKTWWPLLCIVQVKRREPVDVPKRSGTSCTTRGVVCHAAALGSPPKRESALL
jgi:hypothetical protein